MQYATFNAQCPFEIGDKIRDEKCGDSFTITDIACTHFVKTNRVEFRYELNNSGRYVGIVVPDNWVSV